MKTSSCCVLLSCAFLVGCGSDIPPEPAASPPAAPIMPAAAEPAPDVGAGMQAAPSTPSEAPSAPAVQPAPTSPPPAAVPVTGPDLAPPAQAIPPSPAPSPDMERVKAEKGVGVKGRSLDQYEGALVTPAKAFFSVRERAVFEIQIPEAIKLFKATNGNGPKSHAEFMAQIVDANQIQLPELPAGQKYVYDPEKEELMVERPAR